MVKVGNQLFTAEGPSVVRALARMGFGIFLDLKFQYHIRIVCEKLRQIL